MASPGVLSLRERPQFPPAAAHTPAPKANGIRDQTPPSSRWYPEPHCPASACLHPSLPHLLTLPAPPPKVRLGCYKGQKKGGGPPMASSLCPLHGGLAGQMSCSPVRPLPHQAFSSSLPDNNVSEARPRPLLPVSAELGFFQVYLSVSLSPAPAQWCRSLAACPGVLKAQMPLSTEPGQAGQADGRDTRASREDGDAHRPQVIPVNGSSPRSTTALEADLSTGPLTQGSPCAGVPCAPPHFSSRHVWDQHPTTCLCIHSFASYYEPWVGAGLKKCQHGLPW